MGRSKLTEENKDEIRQLSKEGYSLAALAAKFDVSKQTIHRTLNPDYYTRTLEQSKEYQRTNAKQLRKKRAKSIRDYRLAFSYKNDAAVIERLDKEENVNDYIRNLVTDDIKKNPKAD